MKWKGRRQSTNIEIRERDPAAEFLVNSQNPGGGRVRNTSENDARYNQLKEMVKAGEKAQKNKKTQTLPEKNIPAPTPNPRKAVKTNRLKKK